MTVYIFTTTQFTRKESGQFVLENSNINGVYSDKFDAMDAAISNIKRDNKMFGGFVETRSCFIDEVFSAIHDTENTKTSYIVTRHEVA